MSSLKYVGPTPNQPQHIMSRLATNNQLNSGVSRSYVDGRVITLSSGKATKAYVDSQDGQYELISYYQDQDALNIPFSQKGVANGVAPLDASGKIPSIHIPVLGAGVVKGPFGPTTAHTVTTGTTPVKILEWNIGVEAINFQPLVFICASVNSSGNALPIIEVRIGGPSDTTYESQTLVASGHGRSHYYDDQTVTVLPAPANLNEMQDGIQDYYSAAMDIRLTAWMYNGGVATGQVSTQPGTIWAASAWLLRVAT